MKIYFPAETVKVLAKMGCVSESLRDPDSVYRGVDMESREILAKDYEIIKRAVQLPELEPDIENRRILKKIQALEELRGGKGKGKSKVLRILDVLPEIIRDEIGKTPHKWLFMSDHVFGAMLPWFLTDAEYHAAERTQSGYRPAHVTVSLNAMRGGKEVDHSLTFYKSDLEGSTLAEILSRKDILPETPALVADYEADLEKYSKHFHLTGEQYLAIGRGCPSGDGRWGRDTVNLELDGIPSKVVMDDLDEEKRITDGHMETDFWVLSKKQSDDDVSASFKLPVQPIVCVFSLHSHEYVDTHISNIEPYKYDATLASKLVLPDDHKRLIDVLTRQSAARQEDIIRGKASGVIVLCSGLPGTGKTLTAEIYSEVVERPLYSVQCSQLGTDEEALEKSLQEVLSRAARWKAILLIDEADVYIHERGESIRQNAIVGIFLRLLEYFRGIMFMTTNRATVIDDAIMSRVTAHVRYKPPTELKKERQLWIVLSRQFGVTGLDIDAAIKEFPNISGRSVRQVLRLAAMMDDPAKVTVKHLKWASQFYDFPELGERKETT